MKTFITAKQKADAVMKSAPWIGSGIASRRRMVLDTEGMTERRVPLRLLDRHPSRAQGRPAPWAALNIRSI
jgi:hypothetical protein